MGNRTSSHLSSSYSYSPFNRLTATQTKYLHGLGIDNKLRSTNRANISYFLSDHLGSTNGLVNASGTLTASNSYDSFGNPSNSAFPSRYQFTGREYDSYTGLQYSRARFYDPKIGRFTSEDPIGFRGKDVNLYGYVWNSPNAFTDHSGLDGWGNDFADWVDDKVNVAEDFYGVNPIVSYSPITEPIRIWDIPRGFGDQFRVGSGIGQAIYCEDNVYGKAAFIATDIARAAGLASEMIGPFAGRVGVVRNGRFPSSPQAMDDALGFPGNRIPDNLNTPGRGKVKWQPSDNVTITYEQHPYHPNAPDWHKGPHYHVDWPDNRHVRYLPGDKFPGL